MAIADINVFSPFISFHQYFNSAVYVVLWVWGVDFMDGILSFVITPSPSPSPSEMHGWEFSFVITSSSTSSSSEMQSRASGQPSTNPLLI